MSRGLGDVYKRQIALAIVVWIGWSAYDMYESKQPRAVAEVDYSAVSNYVQSLNTAE